MRATITMAAVALMGYLMPVSAWADCELSCNAECRQEAVVCNGAANLEGKIGRQQCEADAGDAVVLCETDALDARSDCVGLCGPNLKECSTAAKVALKTCKETAKIELAGCANQVATQFEADRAVCVQESTDCAATCIG
jgi:hypothetical protein